MERGGLKQALAGQGMRRGDLLVWADEFTVALHGRVVRIWGPVGEELRQSLDVRHDSAHVALVVEPLTGKLGWQWLSRSQQQRRERARAQVRAQVRGESVPPEWVNWMRHLGEAGVRAVVWDGSGMHRDGAVRKVAQEHEVALIRQPSASPELNPAERVIEAVRQATEGRVFGTLESKIAAVNAALLRLEEDPEAVRRLTCWDWIERNILELPA